MNINDGPDDRDETARPAAAVPARRVSRPIVAVCGVLGVLLGLVVGLWSGGAFRPSVTTVTMGSASSARPADPSGLTIKPRPVSDAALAALPQATTFSTLVGAPPDPQPQGMPSGEVVHPVSSVPLYVAPGGPAIAAAPAKQWATDTWFPVVASQPGWDQVLLQTRPNGATGWVSTTDARIQAAYSPYRIVVDRAAFRLTLSAYQAGSSQSTTLGDWSVGVGTPDSVTPPGRTFLLASILEDQPSFSPIIVPLGTHSDSYETYGGGPGTVGLHTWPTGDVYGRASSHGCVRVPQDALTQLSQLPAGTPVLIY